MHILIIGDSWGYSLPEIETETNHNVEYTFIKHGHYVFNKSIWGGTNQVAVQHASTFCKNTYNIFKLDYIIWFVTDVGRDYGLLDIQQFSSYGQFLDEIQKSYLKFINYIKNLTPSTKWILIGGHTPIYKPENYDTVDLIIKDWQGDVHNDPSPNCQFIGDQSFLFNNRNIFTMDEVEQESVNYENYLKYKEKHVESYFDKVHFKSYYHNELALKLLNWMTQNG